MININCYRTKEGIYLPQETSDRWLIMFLTGGSPGFMADELDRLKYVAAALNWKIVIV
jgi:hypothetical protein